MAERISIIQKAPERPAAPVKTSLVGRLMECQQSLAVCHWATESFAEHKALGKAYEDLAELLDSFVESLMGLKGRAVLGGIASLKITKDCSTVLNSLEGLLRNDVTAEVGPRETSLLNLRDEMLDLVLHTRYLLTLK